MNDFAEQLKDIRKAQAMSMQNLADKAGVSKSLISKVEGKTVVPSLDVSCRLAHALGTTLSSMLGEQADEQVIIIKKGKHTTWKENETSLLRENLSPAFSGSKIEWLRLTLPAKQRTGSFPRIANLEKYLLLESGEMEIILGDETVSLSQGDSLYFKANREHHYFNKADSPSVFYMVINQRDI